MYILEYLEKWGVYIQLATLAVSVVFFLLSVVLIVKQHKLKKKYNQFMSGKDGKNLEDSILSKYQLLDNLSQAVSKMDRDIQRIDNNLLGTYQKVGIVKYDAFQEVGGKLSFVLALLTKEDDGFIMNCMHSSREGCFTYIKEVSKGQTFVILSEEESQALSEAKSNRKFIQ